MDQEMVYEANGEDLLKPRSAQMLRADELPERAPLPTSMGAKMSHID